MWGCELLTDNYIIKVPNSEELLYGKEAAKYLGQILDSDGTLTIVITRRFFGKIINILSRNPELSRKAIQNVWSEQSQSPCTFNGRHRMNKANLDNNA